MSQQKNIANYANEQNINTENFFNEETSEYILKKYKYSKIIFSLKMFLAHVPNVNSFVKGIKNIL